MRHALSMEQCGRASFQQFAQLTFGRMWLVSRSPFQGGGLNGDSSGGCSRRAKRQKIIPPACQHASLFCCMDSAASSAFVFSTRKAIVSVHRNCWCACFVRICALLFVKVSSQKYETGVSDACLALCIVSPNQMRPYMSVPIFFLAASRIF